MTDKDDVIRGQEWAGMALTRENERLRAEIEQLKHITDWADMDELRAEVERLQKKMTAHRETYVAAMAGSEKVILELRAEVERLKAESGAWTIGYQTAQIEAQAENERLQQQYENSRAVAVDNRDECERLRAALKEIVDHPAPSNVARVARAALARHME